MLLCFDLAACPYMLHTPHASHCIIAHSCFIAHAHTTHSFAETHSVCLPGTGRPGTDEAGYGTHSSPLHCTHMHILFDFGL